VWNGEDEGMSGKSLSVNREPARQLAAARMGGKQQDSFARGASGGLAHELPCDADATKPRLVDFLRFLDQDVHSTDRPEVSRTDGKNLALPLIRGVTDPRQRDRRRAGNDAALADVNLTTRVFDKFKVVALLER
jgi:hypothetical protein